MSAALWRRYDLLAAVAALTGITLLCWWYVVDMALAMDMSDMPEMALMPWSADYLIMMLLMWAVMMIGMMLPSAMPMILIYLQVARKNRLPWQALCNSLFVLGYVLVWGLFGLLATLLQWQLEQWALLSAMMESNSVLLSAGVLVCAGLYQWSPWKTLCLKYCQSPFVFISRHWRPGLSGALRMGFIHGAFCVGCCWLLMLLLFIGGVMNLLLIALIAGLVLLEKILPAHRIMSSAIGAVLLLLGLWLMLGAITPRL